MCIRDRNIEDALKKEYSDGIKNVKYTYLTREDSTFCLLYTSNRRNKGKWKNKISPAINRRCGKST